MLHIPSIRYGAQSELVIDYRPPAPADRKVKPHESHNGFCKVLSQTNSRNDSGQLANEQVLKMVRERYEDNQATPRNQKKAA
ncbi:hypothetical protein D3C86_635090 [compost metagenome]